MEFLVRELGMSFTEAWEQCSTIPARMIGERLPGIEAGEEASFVLARWDDGLVIEQSVHLGVPYLKSPIQPTDAQAR